MKKFAVYFKRALILTLVLLVCCSVIYPLALTGIGQLLFPKQSNGSLIEVDGKVVGSELIGQNFEGDEYFKGRISSVQYNTYTEEEKEDGTYAGVGSGSFNYAPTNEELQKRVKEDVEEFKTRYQEATGTAFEGEIPADLMTASGSGLDPHISPESAEIQIPIVAANSGLTEEEVSRIVEKNTEHQLLGIFGEERVNVLKCNLAVAEAMAEEE